MNIEVLPATSEQEPVVANLLELYAHDFSEFHALEIGQNGRFGYKDLPLYWVESHRHPFLVRIEGRWAGLILVMRGSRVSGAEDVWDMAEFFVMRGYRRRGIGTSMARQVWERFPGRWEIRVEEQNVSAHGFWEHAISKFLNKPIQSVRVETSGRSWDLFSFDSDRRLQ